MCSLSSVSTITRRSHEDRAIRQFVGLVAGLRVVPGKVRSDTAYPGDGPLFELALPEGRLHFLAHRLPRGLSQFGMDAAVCHDLDVAIREQQIDQHAVVV